MPLLAQRTQIYSVRDFDYLTPAIVNLSFKTKLSLIYTTALLLLEDTCMLKCAIQDVLPLCATSSE